MATWTVTVATDGLPVRTTTPAPATDDGGGTVSWTGLTADEARQIDVAVRWPSGLAVERVLGLWPAKSFTEVPWDFCWWVVFLPPLVLVRRYRKRQAAQLPGDPAQPHGDPAQDNTWQRSRILVGVCVVGMVLTVLKPLDDLVSDEGFGVFERWLKDIYFPGWMPGEDHAGDVYYMFHWQVLVLLTGGLYLWGSYRPDRSRANLLRHVAVTWTVVTLGMLLVGVTRIWAPSGSPWTDYDLGQTTLGRSWRALAVLGAVATPMAVSVYFMLAALMCLIVKLWPVDRHGAPRDLEPARRTWVAVHWAAFGLTVVVIGFAIMFSRSDWQHLSVLGNDTAIGQPDWVVWELWTAPYSLLIELLGLLTNVAVVGVIALVHPFHLGTDGPRRVFFGADALRFEVPALVFVFAAWSLGSAGEVVTLNAPIVFVVGYFLLKKVALSTRLEVLDGAVVADGTAPPVVP
ncbi:hypothetical protein ACFQ9X_00630 [Catenulispora yoronensis]